MVAKKYEHIAVEESTKIRFDKLGCKSDTADSLLNKVMDKFEEGESS